MSQPALARAARAECTLRDAGAADLPAIQRIYAHHVETGFGSFEEVPPDRAEMERRWRALVDLGRPYLVAERGGEVLGFAYAASYRLRVGYRHSVEDSIYIAEGAIGDGVGRALLAELIERCTELGLRQMVAVIGDSGNEASIRLHEALGFVRVGAFRAVGYKFGRWVDTVLMQRALGDGEHSDPTG